jgi:hypothetical protein
MYGRTSARAFSGTASNHSFVSSAGVPRPRAPSRQLFPLKVTVCAWCGSRSIAGIWDELDLVLHTFITGERHFVTHGICPTCFDECALVTPYPRP